MTARPASAAQVDIWLSCERNPRGGLFNIATTLRSDEGLDVEALRAAWGEVVAHHPQLRSHFANENGTLTQYFGETTASVRVERHPDEDLPGAVERVRERTALPFDLSTGPLHRCEVVAYRGGTLICLVVHHIVADGWSVGLLIDHLVTAYGRHSGSGAAALPARSPDLEEQIGPVSDPHWASVLSDDVGQLAPLPDRFTGGEELDTAHVLGRLPGPVAHGMVQYCRVRNLTPAAAAIALWSVLIAAWAGEDEGLIGVPFAGRVAPETHGEVGLYARVLPIRVNAGRERRLGRIVTDIRDQLIDAMLADPSALELSGVGARGDAMSFQAIVAHFDQSRVEWTAGDRRFTAVDIDSETGKFPLSFAFMETDTTPELRIDYDRGTYDETTASVLLDQFGVLVELLSTCPESTVLEALEELSRRFPVVEHGPIPTGRLTPPATRVLKFVAEQPHSTALVHGDVAMSWYEFGATVCQLAQWLQARGVDVGDVVALLLPRGIGTVVAMVACNLAGAAYLPLEPEYPDATLDAICADARPVLVLTAGRAVSLPIEHVGIDGALAEAADYPETAPDIAIDLDQPMNLLYTSGSTGRPKGVILPHRGLARLLDPSFLRIETDDIFSHLSPLNFDGASYEIWGCLGNGGTLVILDKELVLDPLRLRDELRFRNITTLLVTTPLLNRLIEDAPEALTGLRRVYFGGEMVSVPHIRRALQWCSPGTLLHSYGPTENSFTSSYHPISVADLDRWTIPIGLPVTGTAARIVAPGTDVALPPGVPGELLLGGSGVALGYVDPSAAGFVVSPWAMDANAYRSGDRCRRNAKGQIEFIGRRDEQIKIRSQRVELGEVEAALLACDGVKEAFACARRTVAGEKEILGYVVWSRIERLDALWDQIRRTLPSFAVPRHLITVDRLPLKPNGKIDRARLPDPVPVPADGTRPDRLAAGATTGTLSPVRQAWAETLGHTDFTDFDNFFDVGGHSLLLVRLQARIAALMGAVPTIGNLLDATTVAMQAALLGGKDGIGASKVGSRAAEEPIAIIGLGARAAGARDVLEFWANLRAGRDCLPDPVGAIRSSTADGRKTIARWGTIADGLDFDGVLFGLPVGRGAVDPQHGILYETLWSAVEDAGLRIDTLPPRTSVFAGRASWNLTDSGDSDDFVPADAVVGTDRTFLATRFSYWFDLLGESVVVDTACSTSLVAVHMACEALRSGSCDVALAAGVSISDPTDGCYEHIPGYLYSSDGFCRPFDARATGTVGGDGAGAVVLRRLSDALRDGDPVHAVIAGSAVNNDGRTKVGYTAPGVAGQRDVIETAMIRAGVSGVDIGFVELHGTGTRLGDTIEATALTAALGAQGGVVGVGSVKASIGHTNAAAGVLGFIKAVLAVEHNYWPATPNVAEPIAELTAVSDRFQLVRKGRTWPEENPIRYAGVSSFGVGGTNAHVVVRQHTLVGEGV